MRVLIGAMIGAFIGWAIWRAWAGPAPKQHEENTTSEPPAVV